MPMHLPAVRKGLIPQAVAYDPYVGGMDDYGGVRWAYKKSKRSQCKGYDDAVKEYESHKQKLLKAGCNVFAIFPKKKCKPHRNNMKAAEKKGKAAWKECQAYSKGEKKGHVQVDTGAGFTNVASTGPMAGDMMGGMIDPLTGLPVDPMAASYVEEESSGMGMWLAVGALVVATGGVVLYKRSKKKKGGKKK